MTRKIWVVVVALLLAGCSSGTSTSGSSTSPSASPTSSVSASPGASGSTPSTTATGASGTATSVTVTKEAFVAQALPICRSVTTGIDALPDLPADKAGAISVLDKRAALLKDSVQKLRALSPPTADAAKIQQLLSDMDLVIADTIQELAAYRAGDTVKAAQLEVRFDNDEKKAKAEANDYGLGDCGV